jgi:septum formation protein
LLSAAGIVHRVVASRYAEDDIPGVTGHELVATHAAGKAREVAARAGVPDRGAVLGADTAVLIDATVLGKPADRDEARQMLTLLAGREHVVATAVCLITADAEHAFVDESVVRFRPFGDGQIAWYLERGEWQGRAGAYAIQGSGASLVARVEGDFTTVVGLPIGRLLTVLEACGLAPWQTR